MLLVGGKAIEPLNVRHAQAPTRQSQSCYSGKKVATGTQADREKDRGQKRPLEDSCDVVPEWRKYYSEYDRKLQMRLLLGLVSEVACLASRNMKLNLRRLEAFESNDKRLSEIRRGTLAKPTTAMKGWRLRSARCAEQWHDWARIFVPDHIPSLATRTTSYRDDEGACGLLAIERNVVAVQGPVGAGASL